MTKWSWAAACVLLFACGKAPKPAKPAAPVKPQVTDSGPVPKPSDSRPVDVPDTEPVARDLDLIRSDGALKVLFTFNSTGYFIYRGETMGYEYELLAMFARDMKLRLKPVVARDSRVLFEKLNLGDADVVAAQLAASTNQTEIATTAMLYATSPVLVQRANREPAEGTTPTVARAIAREERDTTGSPIEIRARLITTPSELAGHEVQIPRTSPYRTNLLELNEELTNDIEVVEVDDSSDKLIQKLAEGQIGYTVAAQNLAQLKTGEYTNLIIKPAMGPPQPIVWGLRRNAPQLQAALNRWIEAKRKSGLLAVLYRKYFLDRRGFQKRVASQYLTAETGALSPYDAWFQEYSKIPGWDWRLIAAQAYQESKFNPNARSWAGAAGLMQIMPRTARELRVNPRDARGSIEAACRYLWKIDQQWQSIENQDERLKFILASYNVGIGHVQDAVRLAKKYGDNAWKWNNVAYWLIRKSKRAVYNDPVVKHGYARGTEPVTYVDQILSRWENYREFVTDAPSAASAP